MTQITVVMKSMRRTHSNQRTEQVRRNVKPAALTSTFKPAWARPLGKCALHHLSPHVGNASQPNVASRALHAQMSRLFAPRFDIGHTIAVLLPVMWGNHPLQLLSALQGASTATAVSRAREGANESVLPILHISHLRLSLAATGKGKSTAKELEGDQRNSSTTSQDSALAGALSDTHSSRQQDETQHHEPLQLHNLLVLGLRIRAKHTRQPFRLTGKPAFFFSFFFFLSSESESSESDSESSEPSTSIYDRTELQPLDRSMAV